MSEGKVAPDRFAPFALFTSGPAGVAAYVYYGARINERALASGEDLATVLTRFERR